MTFFPELPAFSPSSMLRRDKWLILLRWYAVIGLLAGVGLLKALHVGPQENIARMALTGGFLAILNLVYMAYASGNRHLNMTQLVTLLNVQMLMDLLVLTSLIYITGGEESPLSFFYVFHIILASIIFPGGFSYLYSFLVIMLYSSLLSLEFFGRLNHMCFFPEIHVAGNPRVVFALWLVFVITMIVAAYLAQNVTERHRRVRRKLQVANNKLWELNESKTTFFRYASHEMKAPVATIQSTLMVIQDLLKENEDHRVHNMLNRAIGRTDEIIDMLKDLADLTYGKLQQQQFEDLDLADLLINLVRAAQPNAERKHQTLQCIVPEQRCSYYGDRLALSKIFSNLISNAIRYTQEQGKIQVTLVHSTDSCVISVADNGPGIPVAVLDARRAGP